MDSNLLNKLERQLHFLAEIDKAKQVVRNTLLLDKSRQENDAEHSWHMAVAAFVLWEYANFEDMDMVRVFKMILLHDIVEIDAGDVFAYSIVDPELRAKEERKAAERIFGLLPEDQRKLFYDLWIEYDERKTNESKFANALDRFMPIYHNYRTDGTQWKRFNVTKEQVLIKNRHVQEGSKILWEYIEKIVEESVEQGYLKNS
ncbi:MAG: HD domain-containing protein [Clostridia bacterium]|jgi:putative hydrolase of HD superfamily|nr:HD domain-containing protein [Clostridiaceae bacterium]